MQMKKINKFRVGNCLQLFCDIFGILVCNLVMNHSDQERLFTVKVLKAFLFSLLIFVFTIHNFPKEYNCKQSVNTLQELPHNLTVARLLHKFAYSLVKYSQNVA